jgi:mannose-6-phosphate isomerase-like protein (cupin superfamily)
MTDGPASDKRYRPPADWRAWIRQSLPSTDIKRGGATAWPKGARGLIGDSLGPVMHLHDGASEIFYFIDGRCRMEIGDSEELFGPGDFVLVPPEVPHNLWNGGDEDLLVFWLVAPNVAANKWRTGRLPTGAMSGRVLRGRVAPGAELPTDNNIRTRLLTVATPATSVVRADERHEAVVYVVEGEADADAGARRRRVSAHDFVHVPASTPCTLTPAAGPATVLIFDVPGR